MANTETNNSIVLPKDEKQSIHDINLQQIENMVYIIRNKQVMLDSDLALLYKVETKMLNRAVKRNLKRFPDDFCFQLTQEEYDVLWYQIGTAKSTDVKKTDNRGGRRTLPYVFTEQGISMLASVLHSEVAISVSIGIMRTFVEMRRFISRNEVLFERISNIELKQLEYQKQTDEKFEQIYEYLSEHEEAEQKIFFEGQIYDAFSLIIKLIQKADYGIVLIDNYVDISTLNILSKKKKNVKAKIYTLKKSKLSEKDIKNFNAQYPFLEVKYTEKFHDRFLIMDDKSAYHIGASVKDAGKKCFGINQIQDDSIIQDILHRLETQTEDI